MHLDEVDRAGAKTLERLLHLGEALQLVPGPDLGREEERLR